MQVSLHLQSCDSKKGWSSKAGRPHMGQARKTAICWTNTLYKTIFTLDTVCQFRSNSKKKIKKISRSYKHDRGVWHKSDFSLHKYLQCCLSKILSSFTEVMSHALLYLNTYTTAAKQYNQEGLKNSSHSHHPSQPKKENNPEDILHAWQIYPHQGAHAGWLKKKKVDIH